MKCKYCSGLVEWQRSLLNPNALCVRCGAVNSQVNEDAPQKVLVYDAEWPEISIQDWPPAGAVYVSRDCQHRLGSRPAWVVSTMGDGTLEGDTVHHGIFWQREDAELFAESKRRAKPQSTPCCSKCRSEHVTVICNDCGFKHCM